MIYQEEGDSVLRAVRRLRLEVGVWTKSLFTLTCHGLRSACFHFSTAAVPVSQVFSLGFRMIETTHWKRPLGRLSLWPWRSVAVSGPSVDNVFPFEEV